MRLCHFDDAAAQVSVSGVSVLEGDVASAFTILKTADYPKLLRWRRFIDVADNVNLQLGSLQITSPKAAMACFPYRMAKFGDIPPCEPAPLVSRSTKVWVDALLPRTHAGGTNHVIRLGVVHAVVQT